MSLISPIISAIKKRQTTHEQALQCGEISQEIPIYEQENLLVCGNGIFPYKTQTQLHELIESNGGGG